MNKVQIALIRGNGMNSWEGRIWNELSNDYRVVGFCAKNNLSSLDELKFPIERLSASTDSRLKNRLSMLLRGEFQKMKGLENRLSDFDLAHTVEIYNYYTYQAVLAKRSNPKLKVVATVWDNSFGRFECNYWANFMPPTWWRDRVMSIVNANVRGVDRFIAVSDYSASLLEDYQVPKKKIKIIRPALAFTESFTKETVIKYGLDGAPFYLMVNRLKKEKGVYDCLYAWKMFVKKSGLAKNFLVIIGDGPERENMLRLIKEWRLEDSVRYFRQMPNYEVRQLYPYAQALILASLPTSIWQEQFGYVLAEAMSGGCPVISTLSGAIPEVVKDCGILVPPGNPLAITDALVVLQNPAIWEKRHTAAIAAKERFSEERFKKELIELYSELV